MLETFVALLFAHVLADFVLQLDVIARNKRKPRYFALHILIVAVTACIALGAAGPTGSSALIAVTMVTLAHAMLDALKTWTKAPTWLSGARGFNFEAFTLDQLGHLSSILIIAFVFPFAFSEGIWPILLPNVAELLSAAFVLVSGFVIATRAGQFLITAFMERFALAETKAAESPDPGLVNGGAWIGLLERALIFALVLFGRFEAVGFLLAAKSILRFSYAAKDRSHSEYVIIGTLLSFSWAMATASLTALLLQAL